MFFIQCPARFPGYNTYAVVNAERQRPAILLQNLDPLQELGDLVKHGFRLAQEICTLLLHVFHFVRHVVQDGRKLGERNKINSSEIDACKYNCRKHDLAQQLYVSWELSE